MPGFNRCLLDLCRLTEYIYKHQRKAGRYIFSSIEKESIGPQFRTNNMASTQCQSDVVYIGTGNFNNSYMNMNPYLSMPQPVYDNNEVMNVNQLHQQQTSVVENQLIHNHNHMYLKHGNKGN